MEKYFDNELENAFLRLSHEIPSQSGLLKQNINEIEDVLFNSSGENIYFKNTEIEKYLRDLVNEAKYSILILELYAAFSTIRKLNYEEVKKYKDSIEFKSQLKSVVETLNVFAKNFGVNILCNFNEIPDQEIKLSVHPFFLLGYTNILNNAVQYSYFGTNVILKYFKRRDKHIFTFKNMGINIPKSAEKNIFEPGYRTVDARRKWFKGVGFGLSLVKNIIDAHNGSIRGFSSKKCLSERNIFGLYQLNEYLDTLSCDKEYLRLLNTNMSDEKSISFFKKLLSFKKGDKKTLIEYSDFIFKKDQEFDPILFTESYIRNKVFDVNENILIFIRRQIDVPIYLTTFEIELDME